MNIRNQFCRNKQCTYFQLKLRGNIAIHSRKQSRFRCSQCKKTWVAHIGTFEYGLKKDISTIQESISMLRNGYSIRKTGAILKVSPSTIQRWKNQLIKLTDTNETKH